MFCYNCGNKLSEGVLFCPSCGTKAGQNKAKLCSACGTAIPQDVSCCINCGAAVNSGEHSTQASSGEALTRGDWQPTNLIGFSNICNNLEILEVARVSRKRSSGFMWILVFVPLIGFPVAGLLMDDFPLGESVIIGIGIAIVMLIINLFTLHRAKQPIWEGVVTNKFKKEKYEHRDDPSRTYTEYTVLITTDAGRKKTIVERGSRRAMYDYLSVGDRVRYHPQFGTYEKYDKSKDRIIYCNVCSVMNPIQNDRCKWCKNLLFK
jgi:predicted nucleic acid-binding Zn ribbon protein